MVKTTSNKKNGFFQKIQKFNEMLFRTEKAVCLVLMIAMVSVTSVEVVCRYIFNTTLLVGISELINWLFVWIVFIGLGAVTQKKGNIGITYFIEKTPKHFQLISSVLMNIFLLIFCFIVIKTGFRFAAGQKSIMTTAANIPKTYLYLSVPIGMIFVSLHVIIDTLNLLFPEKK